MQFYMDIYVKMLCYFKQKTVRYTNLRKYKWNPRILVK